MNPIDFEISIASCTVSYCIILLLYRYDSIYAAEDMNGIILSHTGTFRYSYYCYWCGGAGYPSIPVQKETLPY